MLINMKKFFLSIDMGVKKHTSIVLPDPYLNNPEAINLSKNKTLDQTTEVGCRHKTPKHLQLKKETLKETMTLLLNQISSPLLKVKK